MPQIPTLPIDEPVARPLASPGQFGSVGETVSELGYATEQMAIANEYFEGHLLGAQRQLKAKQAQINFDRVKNQVYLDLAKTTTPEEAQAVYDHSKGELDNVLTPFETDRVLARELGIYRQQQDVEIQSTVNTKKADIITKADHVANQTLGVDALRNAINTQVGGGDASVPRKQYELQLDSSVAHGTLTPQQRDAILDKWDRDFQSGVVEAYANNPDHKVREQLITQLTTGKGPLDLSKLDAGELARLRTSAIDIDHNLTVKEKAQNLNDAINIEHESSSRYLGDFPRRISQVEDENWLKQNDIVTSTGKVNWALANELRTEIEREWKAKNEIQRDKDEKISEKYFPLIDEHKMSIVQIDKLIDTEGATATEVSRLHSYYHRVEMEERAQRATERGLALEERRQKKEQLEENSRSTSLDLMRRIEKGDFIDINAEVRDEQIKGNLTREHAEIIKQAYNSSQYSDFRDGLRIIDSDSSLDAVSKANLEHAYTTGVRDNKIEPEKMPDYAKKLLDQHNQKSTNGFIDRLFNYLGQSYTGTSKPKTELPPVKGSVKRNSSGDVVRWDGSKWVAQ